MPIKVHLISLGCAKNLVDSEHMLATLEKAGYELTQTPFDCDVAVVNTCGFIESAKVEAIDNILKMAALKEQGVIKALVVTGCLTQRYREEFLNELPEVDAILGTGSYTDIAEAVNAALSGKGGQWFKDMEGAALSGARQLLTPQYYAYLKIAEGCDNHCAYCVIPSLRGRFRSRPIEELLSEARALAEAGVKELIIIAQDITRYGTDVDGKRALPKLLLELEKIPGIEWIRLHYLYPDEVDEHLLTVIQESEKILRYFDIPIQHIDDRILAAMNRRGDSALIKRLIEDIRQRMPDAVIRTSVITGFPGEGEREFETLCDFLREYRLERAGVFMFSPEEGSAAFDMDHQVDESEKRRRYDILFDLQQGIMDECAKHFIGNRLKVLCCGRDEHGRLYGRSYMDSPDIDGIVWLEGEAEEGDFVHALVQGSMGCELFADIEGGGVL